MEIQAEKKVWVAWTNTDRNEGRGSEIPLAVCETRTTAERIGKAGGVQGHDCKVTEETAIKVDNRWLVPVIVGIQEATDEDIRKEKAEKRLSATLKKAKDAGLSREEIEILKGSG